MESTFALPNLPFIPPSLSLTSAPSVSQPATIKMEDLETNTSSSARALSFDDGESARDSSSPPAGSYSSSTSDQRTSKKRRSWGQVLPEPTTNLPPRKRAKTADEKEQRRIERVKRNRLAAHNSRERKRQEVEALQILNQDLEDKLEKMREIASQQDAQLRYFRQMCPDAVSGAPFASLQASLDKTLHQNPFESLTSALSASVTSSMSQKAGPASPGLPNLTSANATPDSLAHTLDSFSMPSTPNAEYAPGTDLTQHSAVSVGFQESPFLSDGDNDFDSGKPMFAGFSNDILPASHPHQSDNLFGNLGGDFNLFNNEPLFPEASDFPLYSQISLSTNLFESIPEDDGTNLTDDVGGSFDGMFADTLAGSGATVSVSDEPGIASV